MVLDTRLGGCRLLGGPAQLATVFRDHDVDKAILTYSTPDRTDFFGALAACRDHGIAATIRREYADSVLIERVGSEVVDVDLEPRHRRDCLVKHLFDGIFTLAGLLVLIPVIAAIAAATKLDSSGPILYSQERTTRFGETFRLYKSRTMTPSSGDTAPVADEENSRIIRIGRFLRCTHLDEIPQLYSILVGDMSVVGPRAAWIEEEEEFLEIWNGQWRRRWFVEPGFTGLAQVNDASSTDPELKLHYDIEYIEHRSISLDTKLIVQQIWMIIVDSIFR